MESVKKKLYATSSVTVLCILLGLMIGVQYNTVRLQKQSTDSASLQRVSELTTKLSTLQAENDALQEKLETQSQQMKEFESALMADDSSFEALTEENERLKMVAGMTAVQGRGISVTINDSSASADGSANPEAFLVHAEDILSIINELNVAGAEAIAINGQRLISQSAVRCAGSVVNVNDVKLAAPFVITAIGDPDLLEAALLFPGGVVDTLRPWGIEILIKKLDMLEIPSYSQPREFREATSSNKG